MPSLNRVHGQVSAGAFYGYSPLVVRITDTSNGFTADTVNATTGAITEGGYAKAVKGIQAVGSIIMLSARTDAGSICAIVDGPSFNAGAGPTTTGAYGALKDAVVSAASLAGTVAITVGTVLANTGAFTMATP